MKLLEAIVDASEFALRQVHPNFVKKGRLTSEAFQPTRKDAGLLSVGRSSMRTPANCYERHIAAGWKSMGVLAVTVGECAKAELEVLHAPLDAADPEDGITDEAHAVIDFRKLPSRGAIEKMATLLRDVAKARGYLHPLGAGTSHDVADSVDEILPPTHPAPP